MLGCVAFVVFCFLFYHWKGGHPQEFTIRGQIASTIIFAQRGWFPFNLPGLFERTFGDAAKREGNLLYTLKNGFGDPSWDYGCLYSVIVVVFGIIRIRRRRTPYVTRQTLVLMAVQVFLLFLIPDVLLAWAGRNGWFEPGHPLRGIADHLFESYDGPRGHERAYWRAIGFVLAWPLLVYNVFMDQPNYWWLGISFVQTFVLIPLIVWRWGKGAYCGWLCSCGALAETLGDAHRRKMPHGPGWNRLNMLGQVVLAFAFALLGFRIAGWVMGPQSWPSRWRSGGGSRRCRYLNYQWSVDLLLSGVLGIGLYFWFSGRTWCRFACPLAALMHIYARFTRFRIFPDKKKCISLQRLHERLPPRHRHHEFCQQRRADGGPAMRAVFGVRAGMSDGRAELRALRRRGRQGNPARPIARFAGVDARKGAREITPPMTDVWIDTDPSIGLAFHEADDGFALVQAFHSPEIRIRGISTTYGNAGLWTTTRIAREMVIRFGGPAKLIEPHVHFGAASARDIG